MIFLLGFVGFRWIFTGFSGLPGGFVGRALLLDLVFWVLSDSPIAFGWFALHSFGFCWIWLDFVGDALIPRRLPHIPN